jgi:CspA family cold shock protein
MSTSPGGTRADDDDRDGEAGGPESGTVRWFDERRGYGFIARPAAIDVFFHGSAVAAPRPLAAGDRVLFAVVEAPRGLQARRVRLADPSRDGTSGEAAT